MLDLHSFHNEPFILANLQEADLHHLLAQLWSGNSDNGVALYLGSSM